MRARVVTVQEKRFKSEAAAEALRKVVPDMVPSTGVGVHRLMLSRTPVVP